MTNCIYHRMRLSAAIIAMALASSTIMCGQKLLPQADNDRPWGDTTRTAGVPFSKDPHVVWYKGNYLMFFSVPPGPSPQWEGWAIGIAKSSDLNSWEKIGEITPAEGCDYEQKGLCAPGAIVRNDTIHLFYQTYGNGRNDAICHAWSTDGLHFTRNATNPVFHPTGAWNCGRAIDAEVVEFNGEYYLYSATRTPDFRIQNLTVAKAPGDTNFNRDQWTQASDASVLYPVLPWEGECIEAPTALVRDGKIYLAYAGAYNNCPQQIGMAVSNDGIHFARLSSEPILPVGESGSWNSSESGHPHLFSDPISGNTYLFYQGNNSNGKNWVISKRRIVWEQ